MTLQEIAKRIAREHDYICPQCPAEHIEEAILKFVEETLFYDDTTKVGVREGAKTAGKRNARRGRAR